MGYSPLPYQLDCGYFPEAGEVKGQWCSECWGVTAFYKEDWQQILSTDIGMCLSAIKLCKSRLILSRINAVMLPGK
jgi:hypothetical protein